MDQKETEELLTVNELMKMLKLSRPTIYRYIDQNRFIVYKMGKTLRISKQSVLDFLSQHKI